MSEAGAMQLVTIRLKYQSRFDNKSDKADAIWAHIHDEFIQLVDTGDLPSTDGRSAQALQTLPERAGGKSQARHGPAGAPREGR